MRSSSHYHHHKKKKIRRRSRSHQKSKLKRHHRNASLSLSDDDDLSFSSSDLDDSRRVSSSSDSEDEFKSRKRRRTQGVSKSTRKRARRTSHRGDDGRKKRKKTKSKEHTASEVKKKKTIKRNRRNTCSLSSDSRHTCSTCGGCSSGDSELERSRKQDKSKLGTRGWQRYRSLSRSPSCSGCSRRSRCPSEERFVEESFPKRLGSIVTVVKQSNETERRDWSKDDNKADIIQAYDDCPSSRSNDSYDNGRKKEGGMMGAHWDHMLENKRNTDGNVDGAIQCSQKEPVSSDFGLTPASLVKKSEISLDTGSSEVDEQELRLRIKALENFTKFRRGLYANAKSLVDQKDGSAVAKESAAKAESIQKAKAACPIADGKSASSIEAYGGICDVSYAHESNATLNMNTLPSAGSQMSIAGNAKGKPYKSMQLTSAFRLDPSGSGHSINHRVDDVKSVQVDDHTIISDAGTSSKENLDNLKQAPKIPESSNKMLLEQILLDRDVSVIPEATHVSKLSMHGLEINNGDASVPKVSSSCKPDSEDHALKDQNVEEAKGGSQFEQKTMSVMRRGEMVQVSYKVYIPKKPPALARRQLQR